MERWCVGAQRIWILWHVADILTGMDWTKLPNRKSPRIARPTFFGHFSTCLHLFTFGSWFSFLSWSTICPFNANMNAFAHMVACVVLQRVPEVWALESHLLKLACKRKCSIIGKECDTFPRCALAWARAGSREHPDLTWSLEYTALQNHYIHGNQSGRNDFRFIP